MSFNSPGFAIFFTLVFALNWLLIRRPTLRLGMLTAASAYFYGCREPWWLIPLVVQTGFDWWFAREIDRPGASEKRRRGFLTLSIAANLALLGYFKYHDFALESAAAVASWFGGELRWTPLALALPAGISFYTFVTMSYTIDVYRGDLPASRTWLPFAFFVGFFPHLVAGPIIRAASFMPQVGRTPGLDSDRVKSALFRIAFGLFKKIVIADFLAQFATQAFGRPAETSVVAAWVGVFAFTFQIYYDFCGYSDVAIGVARLLGYELCENFDRPYVAASVTEFWRRWHMSLSTWLRDYAGVFFYAHCPLSKRRHGKVRTVWALMITMLACGLWHGAAWHFVIWGGLQGLFLVAELLTGTAVEGRGKSPLDPALALRRLGVFLLMALSWIVFRASDAQHLGQMAHALVASDVPVVVTRGMELAVLFVLFGLVAQYVGEYVDVQKQFLRLPVVAQGLVYSAMGVAILVGASGGEQPFIYFQF